MLNGFNEKENSHREPTAEDVTDPEFPVTFLPQVIL